MIDRREVMDFAERLGLEPRVIEKDYILGWVLAGIHNHPALRESWVFKGGTCLKKCYFETYRFSEDLDFTLSDPAHIAMDFLTSTFAEVAAWVSEQSGIEVPVDSISFDIHPDPTKKYVEGRVGYAGPLGRNRGSVAKIKLDLTANEVLVLPPVQRESYHPYSDRPTDGLQARCYAFEEVFAEKVRALAERLRPRDLYDVVHLFRRRDLVTDRALIFSTLERKCEFKRISVPTFQIIENHPHREELEPDWERMLRHQLASLPTIDAFWSELPEFFDWLVSGAVRPQPQPYQVRETGTMPWVSQRPAQLGQISGAVERIRMAAANRVCIKLTYSDEQRTVEPYSFRRSSDNNLLFYGFHREDQQMKCFRVDRIQRVEVTGISFAARYPVEIDVMGSLRAPPVVRPRRR